MYGTILSSMQARAMYAALVLVIAKVLQTVCCSTAVGWAGVKDHASLLALAQEIACSKKSKFCTNQHGSGMG